MSERKTSGGETSKGNKNVCLGNKQVGVVGHLAGKERRAMCPGHSASINESQGQVPQSH